MVGVVVVLELFEEFFSPFGEQSEEGGVVYGYVLLLCFFFGEGGYVFWYFAVDFEGSVLFDGVF